jgi:hypothetical protein
MEQLANLPPLAIIVRVTVRKSASKCELGTALNADRPAGVWISCGMDITSGYEVFIADQVIIRDWDGQTIVGVPTRLQSRSGTKCG